MKYRTRLRFESFFHGMDIARRVILGIVFWSLIVLLILGILVARNPPIMNGSILILHPHGSIVDSYTTPASYQGLPVSGYLNETLLSDLIRSLEIAAEDRKIDGVWLYLNDLYSVGPAGSGELADAIKIYKESGKQIIATADTYDTSRYRIAAAADMVIVDRLGEVFPAGYGSWRAYYAEGLEKLGAEATLFRSGESKTGAENYIRDDMSDAALRNEKRLLGDLWISWLEAVAIERNLTAEELDEWIQNYDRYLISAGGDGSKAALNAGLVDAVESGGIISETLGDTFNSLPEGLELSAAQKQSRYIDFQTYLRKHNRQDRGDGRIAVVPVSGSLVYGQGGANTAGSYEIVTAIEKARNTRGVEALVLRIDSPGGDVRAGEEIRRALEETRKDWNIPVVVSMGDLAASGGYWIAVESDYIYTRPETITGSIGVYSLSLSFEKALADWLGVRIDGWGTTPWSGSGHAGRSMDDRTAALYEASVKDIDLMFRNLVAEKRGLELDEVDPLAGGIPWSGVRALRTGLADEEGGLNDALRKAGELAELSDPEILYYDRFVNPRTEMLSRLMWGPSARNEKVFGSGFFRGFRR